MSVEACAAIVQRGDPERFRLAMAAPVPARRILFPLYAFNVEVARAPWVTQEAMIAEMRLQWWRDVLAEIESGGEVRRHEVATPLAEVLRAAPELCAPLDDLVLARRWDIYREPHADAAAQERYLEQTAGTLMGAAARLLSGEASEAAAKAGFGQGLAAYLRAVPELSHQGRIPLVDGRPEAVKALAQTGLTAIASARRHRFGAAAPALRGAWLAVPVLKAVQRDPMRVEQGDLALSEASQAARLLWMGLRGR
ncbi:squalene/phytoene synthase family protein [Pseudoruegeria sp. SHC-113]|uniref:squalene/phytoene synthase family protein n=1 Tax=Pseudoruegeria sp. SHC-113 TaxID=2855439 RepID=UPI0021BA482D|nr:squalene/phytoene synthase family protein [Pseudoruegeria sp. SHC-113]MCT8160590.1 squalene/phytoene synthase family protein [Pseudoruegeria sp. SHC-113]